MKRSRRHKIKEEMAVTSTSRTPNPKDHDLAYYIHDRVELMHQVFSVLKPKELKAMAPECVRHISISDLQELCTEELLGISSKRLCAILDGADPPTDTDTSESSPERLETISLDSISSDDEILSQVSTKKKKHKHHTKNRSKKRKSRNSDDDGEDQQDKSRRTGLTVLEILELQARARAIRAQLQKEQAVAASPGHPSESVTGNSSDGEVEIKEEAAEVVEISSEDEKPNIHELEEKVAATRKESDNNASNSKTITKKVKDLVITVPKSTTSRKIKLKRTNNLEKNTQKNTVNDVMASTSNDITVTIECNKAKVNTSSTQTTAIVKQKTNEGNKTIETSNTDAVTDKDRNKDKKKKRKKDKQKEKDGSDHDEITLQLSDTEKMDLLEDLEGKNFEQSCDTEDSSEDSDSEDESIDKNQNDKLDTNKKTKLGDNTDKEKSKDEVAKSNDGVVAKEISNLSEKTVDVEELMDSNKKSGSENISDGQTEKDKSMSDASNATDRSLSKNDTEEIAKETDEPRSASTKDNAVTSDSEVINVTVSADQESGNTIVTSNTINTLSQIEENETTQTIDESSSDMQEKTGNTFEIQEVPITELTEDKVIDNMDKDKSNSNDNVVHSVDEEKTQSNSDSIQNVDANEGGTVENSSKGEKSEGELSDRDSSEVEATELKPDVVCISDDEVTEKKKKKKDKKCKKSKKSKKNKDFRESADQNFYLETNANMSENVEMHSTTISVEEDSNQMNKNENLISNDVSLKQEIISIHETQKSDSKPISLEINVKSDIDDDVCEILELSDDSSCYEVEEISISKEPTAEEIEALSAKIDEIERDRNINMNEREGNNQDVDNEDLTQVSWKDRYLKSSKVKKVLSTANILNAIRKKNLDLKKKLHESKMKSKSVEEDIEEDIEETPSNVLEEGSIQQYNTLEGSTKYVDPVREVNEETQNVDNDDENNENQTKEKETGDTEKDTVTKEMKKDAKQLLKMYKMLLKYNDITKEKDSSKKKKKKKKSKDKDKSVASQTSVAS